ncbi:MAG: hypothetical protein E7627_00880 [Ruminococcaceae bacterium]|nr:hypothetical protein [Oscillospiraceae bacterium]
MNTKRIISAFLALIMLCGILPLGVSAAWEDKVDEEGNPLINYLTTYYETAESKLATMVLVREQYGYQLYYEEFTGEIAVVDTKTGQTFFSNPYDIANVDYGIADQTKQELLSQLIITFLDNDVEKTMNSYVEAALRGQITMKPIKNGIRVEYAIGEEAVTRLVPRVINKERFLTMILNKIPETTSAERWDKLTLESYFDLKDKDDPTLTEKMVAMMQVAFPITKTMAVYTIADNVTALELKKAENIIKKYCPDYTYEELEYDHELTGYTVKDEAPPRFRMALEYTLNENGLEVRLPANGITFDESAFQFKTVTVLPYFGAGSNLYTGYTMIPDGSGALIRFEDFAGESVNISGQLYGADYAYHEIAGQHSEVMRMPVYGVVSNHGDYVDPAKAGDKAGGPVTSNGYLAIITEGDSLATLMTSFGGAVHPYGTVYPMFTPRPSDQYNLADSISVSGNATWTVTSKRKYTDSYRIQYIFLNDEKLAEQNGIEDYYVSDWTGMAEAYRDYLTAKGDIAKLEAVKDDIPLFIETFGSTTTTERVLSFPVEVDLPLTTFEDIKTMYNELKELGVGNINFKLTGYANGGLISEVPYNLEWTDVVGGADGFADLVAYAKENGFDIYPDFDFAYIHKQGLFDGISLKKHAIRTIDDRYTTKREYNAALQVFEKTLLIAISPAAYEYLYDEFGPNYLAHGNNSISVSTLGTDLSSDFDEDEPYHREDNKEFTTNLLDEMSKDYENVMIDGGNAYAIKYADVILNASLTSSKYNQSSESVPFMGMVYHGSKVFTGSATNMEGDIDQAILNAIENGAAMYFILSYQNTSSLKEDPSLSQYYSVAYDIWKDDIIKYYEILNTATKDLQASYIVDHEFIDAERIPDADEIAAEEKALEDAYYESIAQQIEKLEKSLRSDRRKARQKIQEAGGVWDPSTFVSDIPAQIEELKNAEPEIPEFNIVGDGKITDKYATTSGTVVRVEYEGNVNFILNYNSFDITVEYNGQNYTVEALGFIRID